MWNHEGSQTEERHGMINIEAVQRINYGGGKKKGKKKKEKNQEIVVIWGKR